MPEDYVRKTRVTDSDIQVPVDIQSSYIMVPVDIQGQAITLQTDELAIETSISREIDTGSETSPVTLLTPSSGKAIETRGVYIFSDSGAGEVSVEFATSGKVVMKLYCNKFSAASMPKVKFVGDTDESLQVSWSGLDTGAKIFVVVVYREV